ncbi:hypothetical protein FBU59_001400 [Linderina macrospora]|uniref:Uncharacterized protein n=1 Tax=Linderina macrospora TaxID=4868 RepID=A0ACC1JEB8_9FUNG|nr:hypothetical protein FBU59_001400 [Linderina macrospora]
MLGGSVIREHYEVDRLAEALANTHLLSQAVLGDSSDDEEEEAAAEAEAIRLIAGRLKDSQSRKLAGDRLLERGGDATSAEKKPSSVRTNTSTLTESSNSDIATVQHAGGAATAQTTNVNTVVGGDAGNVAAVATAAAAAAASAAAGSLPFEIMELTSELELLVGRDQEDYMSDPLSPSSVDLSVLQALGKAVHQQVLLHQQQQVNRRKSNFQINAPPPQLSQPVEQQQQQPEKQPLSLELDEMVQYDQQLQAMAKEVIEYCDESGLRQVFPLSTRWIDWLSRHPHRILPWRKYHDDADDDMENSDDDDNSDCSSESSFGLSPPAQAWPLPPTDILSKARIPMSTRRPLLARNVVPSQRQLPVGIEAHWQYYSVINQIVTVASGIHRQLQDERDHTFVVHQLAALYQFLGGEFSKFKKRIEKVFDAAKQMLDLQPAPLEGPRRKADGQLVAELPRLLDPDCAKVIGKMMQDIIVEALYSKWEIPGEPHTTNTPPTAAAEAVPATTATAATVTGGGGARSKSHGLGIEGSQYVVATLKGRPTRPIVRYLAREMKVVNTAERRRRGRERNMSRNPSLGHLRFQQAVQQQAMQHPLPPLPPQPPQANDKNMAAGHHRGDTPIKAGIDGAAATGGAAVTIVLSAVVSAPEEQHLA